MTSDVIKMCAGESMVPSGTKMKACSLRKIQDLGIQRGAETGEEMRI